MILPSGLVHIEGYPLRILLNWGSWTHGWVGVACSSVNFFVLEGVVDVTDFLIRGKIAASLHDVPDDGPKGSDNND